MFRWGGVSGGQCLPSAAPHAVWPPWRPICLGAICGSGSAYGSKTRLGETVTDNRAESEADRSEDGKDGAGTVIVVYWS